MFTAGVSLIAVFAVSALVSWVLYRRRPVGGRRLRTRLLWGVWNVTCLVAGWMLLFWPSVSSLRGLTFDALIGLGLALPLWFWQRRLLRVEGNTVRFTAPRRSALLSCWEGRLVLGGLIGAGILLLPDPWVLHGYIALAACLTVCMLWMIIWVVRIEARIGEPLLEAPRDS